MRKLLFLSSIGIDIRTLQILESIYGRIPPETRCIEFSNITGTKTVPLPPHRIPREIQIVSLEDFLKNTQPKEYEVLSLLPNTKHTYSVFNKLRNHVLSISTVSLFIPWESSLKAFVRAWVVRLLFSPDHIHSFGYFRFASIFPKRVIQYHSLPNIPKNTTQGSKQLGDYIVFVDQAIPNHPDNSVTHKSVPASNYYQNVTNTLKNLSLQLGKKILICRHPKGTYNGTEFDDLEISSLPTEQTLASANLVIGHYSLALLTAALHDTPIIILDVSPTVTQAIAKETSAFSKLLGACPYRVGIDDQLTQNHIAQNTRRSKLVSGYLYGTLPENHNGDALK